MSEFPLTDNTIVDDVPIPFTDAALLVPKETFELSAIAKIFGVNKDEKSVPFMKSIIEAGTVSVAAKRLISALKAIPEINIATSLLNAAVAGICVSASIKRIVADVVAVPIMPCVKTLFLFNLYFAISFSAAFIPSGNALFDTSINFSIPYGGAQISSSMKYASAITGIMSRSLFVLFEYLSRTFFTIWVLASLSILEYDFVITTIMGTVFHVEVAFNRFFIESGNNLPEVLSTQNQIRFIY